MRTDAYNALALLAAVLASLHGAAGLRGRGQPRVEQVRPRPADIVEVELPDGARGLRDASGVIAKVGDYRRIASASLVADSLLVELCAPERLIAVTRQSKEGARSGFRHAGRAGITSPADLEAILALDPDLLFINHFGDPRYAARLRERGIVVFDLGEMHGVSTLLSNARAIGTLLGQRARAEALIATFQRRLAAVAADVPREARPRALYLSTYGKQLFGGGAGTSYDDVLRYGGLINAAAERYRGWPALDPEQVLNLDPEVLVTRRGMARELCAFPGLEQLRPCRNGEKIVELDPELADDPGLAMLDAAETVRARIHGEPVRKHVAERQEPR